MEIIGYNNPLLRNTALANFSLISLCLGTSSLSVPRTYILYTLFTQQATISYTSYALFPPNPARRFVSKSKNQPSHCPDQADFTISIFSTPFFSESVHFSPSRPDWPRLHSDSPHFDFSPPKVQTHSSPGFQVRSETSLPL